MAAPLSPLPHRADLPAAKRALLAKWLESAAAPAAEPPIPRRPAGTRVPLSFAQESLWFFHRLDPQSPLYNVPIALRLAGPLDAAALQRSINAIVARHEILRTHFVGEADNPTQQIEATGDIVLRHIDLTGNPADGRAAKARALVDEECRRPFDLTRDAALRGLLVRTTATEHTLVLTTHHIAADGWSWGVFFRELATLYPAAVAGRTIELRALPIQFGDFAVWQRQRLGGPALAREVTYWEKQLAGAPEFMHLPTDRPRPSGQTFRGAWEQRLLPARLTEELRGLGRSEGATLFMTLLAAFTVLLRRCSGQTDLVVGTAVADRTHVQLEDLIGCFVNTLPLRSDLSADPTFGDFLRQVRTTSLEAFSHHELPFDQLVAELRPARSPAYSPIVQVMFTLQDGRAAPPGLPGLVATRLDTTTDTAKFDLSLMVNETENGLTAILEFNRDLFDPATAQHWLGHFETLLEGIVANPAQRVTELPLLTPAERRQLLEVWNDTQTDYPRDATIVDLFEQQVRRNPAAVALELGAERVTYGELNRRADGLAHQLRKLGVGPDVPVALCLERSVELFVALLGILKAGGAYASLDPGHPSERLAFMLADLQPPVVLTQPSLRSRLAAYAAHVICVEEFERTDPDGLPSDRPQTVPLSSMRGTSLTAAHLAYISYTSGTTGQPKGVSVCHRGVVRLVRGAAYAEFGPDDIFLQFAPVGFDASTFEIWGALLHGSRLVIHPPGTPSLAELGAFIAERRITTLWLAAGLFHALVDHSLEPLRHVRQLLAGGDTLSPAHVQKARHALPHCRLINGYGPTENTTFTCCHQITAIDGAIPIGRPIANTEVYILDARRQPVPVGVPGELWVGGDGLARGYLNRPDLTAEKFAPHPFKPGARLYRTGDLARYHPDGTIAFLGRIDRQVKLRGFRVELEGIEAQLLRHPQVRACVVTALPDATGERRLVAYIVSADVSPSAEDLRDFLQRKFPVPFVPAAFVFLPALPLTPNGKIDHRALPAPDTDFSARPTAVAPRDLWEKKLVTLWESVLGVAPIGVTDRFFDLGGHSLLALRLVAQIERAFGRRLAVATVFQAQSVEQLAAVLRENRSPAPGQSLLAIQPAGRRPPLYLVHGVGGGMLWGYINLSRHLGIDQPVYGFRAERPPGENAFETIEEMAARYVRELRTFQPEGPYALGGYCFGGNVAFEMARLLEAQGQPVASLALMNSSPPNSDYYRFRWTPPGLVHFAANLFYWVAYFFTWDKEVRTRYVRWKLAQWKKRGTGWFGWIHDDHGNESDEIVNLAALPVEERRLYEVHLRALVRYRCRPYGGKVTLFRTRGHPLVSSFDPLYGWEEFAPGGVALRPMPGGHESLLQEPHVQAVARELQTCLDAPDRIAP